MMQESIEDKVKRLKEENPLSPAIKDQYDLEGLIPGKISFAGQIYDLRTISLAKAEQLVKAGFTKLKKKSTTSSPPATTKK